MLKRLIRLAGSALSLFTGERKLVLHKGTMVLAFWLLLQGEPLQGLHQDVLIDFVMKLIPMCIRVNSKGLQS